MAKDRATAKNRFEHYEEKPRGEDAIITLAPLQIRTFKLFFDNRNTPPLPTITPTTSNRQRVTLRAEEALDERRQHTPNMGTRHSKVTADETCRGVCMYV
eukprot:380973-Rhodomonas_salina.2